MATSHNAADAHVQDEIVCEANDRLDFDRIGDGDHALGSQVTKFGLSRRLEVGLAMSPIFISVPNLDHLICSGLCARIWKWGVR